MFVAVQSFPSDISDDIYIKRWGEWVYTDTGCKVWLFGTNGHMDTHWTGSCINGHVSGNGILDAHYGNDRLIYEGFMLNGKANGRGIVHMPNGDVIDTEFDDGMVGPKVKYSRADGYQYEGGWHEGVEEGHGAAVWSNGVRFEGDWHEGNEIGAGTLSYPSGNVYRGEVRSNIPNGKGTIFIAGGGTIDGEWKDGLPNGHIISVSPNGDRYEGGVVNGRRNGQGTVVSKKGFQYEGLWNDNVPDGQGTYSQNGDIQYSGKWVHGCFWEGKKYVARLVNPSVCKSLSNADKQ